MNCCVKGLNIMQEKILPWCGREQLYPLAGFNQFNALLAKYKKVKLVVGPRKSLSIRVHGSPIQLKFSLIV
jgi:hypothetical protein